MSPGRSEAWDVAPVALLRLDGDGVIIDANEALLEWVGRPAQEVLAGVRLSELLSVGGRIYWETHLSPLLHMQGGVDEVAVELRGPDGRLPVLMSAVVHTGHDGERTVDVALSRATERSRYERELLAARILAFNLAVQLPVHERLCELCQWFSVARIRQARGRWRICAGRGAGREATRA